MDDWKLKISPVVRLNRPNKRFFSIFVLTRRRFLFFCSSKNDFDRVLLSHSQLLHELESKQAFCGEVNRSSRQTVNFCHHNAVTSGLLGFQHRVS